MSVDHALLREKALQVITSVVKEGELHQFTYGTYRKRVEEELSLEAGTLNDPELKAIVHKVAKDYISQIEEAGEDSEEEERPVKKRKSAGAAPKEAKPRKPRAKAAGTTATTKRPEKSRKPAFRSASVVPSSDEDAGGDTGASPSSSKQKPRAKGATKAQRVESESEGSAADRHSKPPSVSVKQGSPLHATSSAAPTSASVPVDRRCNSPDPAQDQREAPKSESELSVLIDEPPARKRKRKGESTKAKAPKVQGRKRKETGKELSKDEETIKRLKSLVVACGVRKVWAKEFKDLEKPSDQIRRLRQILSDLGMSGRMSMEQAKAIKAKREFEQELEDVQEFASKITSGPSVTRSQRRKDGAKDTAADGSESEIEALPKRKNARQSIMAFLGDESE